ncbi:MAG: adenylate/guanylate cyclase domain-containing protein [Limnochordaceae bacterium]|nr:adenylate/guanylate cyclase domain-containing protein [Limnochordaceae bacterium]
MATSFSGPPVDGRGRLARTAALAAALAVLAAGGQLLGLWEPLELVAYDRVVGVRFAAGPPSRAASRIAVIAVDERSLERLGAWPWPASVHARLWQALARSRPAAVGFDVMLKERPRDPADVRALIDAARRLDGLVMPGGAEAPFPELAGAVRHLASIRYPVDPDGRVRRLVSEPGEPPPMAAVLAALANEASGATTSAGPPSPRAAPAPAAGGSRVWWIDWRRPPVVRWPLSVTALFPTYSLADVLDGTVDPSWIEGRVVLVGVTAPGVAGADRHLTSLARLGPVPGVLVHAGAVRALLDPGAVRRAGGWSATISAVLVGLAWAAAGSASGRRAGPARAGGRLLVPLALLGLYEMAAVTLFVWAGWWLPMAAPAMGLLGTQIAAGAQAVVEERRRRRHVEMAFGRYVAREVLEELIRSPDLPAVGGARRKVAVLMADLCSFTPFAERHAPEQVVEALNAYLEAMARPVLEAGGMLDKYLGDGILAVFGAPVGSPGAARRALLASMAIVERVQALNRARASSGRCALDVRVAIHAGEVIVGNVGIPERLDYTAIGDAVNLASRLQDLAGPGEVVASVPAMEAARTETGVPPPAPRGWQRFGPETVTLRGRREPVAVVRWRKTGLATGDGPEPLAV